MTPLGSTSLRARLQRACRGRRSVAPRVRSRPSSVESAVKKQKSHGHIKRRKSARHRAKLKAKHRRVRLRRSSGERKTYR